MNVILKNLYQGENSVKMMIRNGEKIYQQLTRLVFEVDKNSIEFPASGGTDTLTITANENWTMTVPSWLTASAVSGRSSATITLTSQPTEEYLEGDIVITCNGVQKTVGITAGVHDYSKDYLTIEVLENGDFYVKAPGRYTRGLFSKNGAEWENIQDYAATTISVKMGDVLRFKGNPYSPSDKLIFSGNTIDFVAYGNPQSLHYLDNFVDISNYRELSNIFKDCSGLVDASNVVIPSNSVSCNNMFQGCTSLTTAPELPATALSNSCYSGMFYGCTSLTKAPELPATTLANNCYQSMFYNCTSLTAAPSIINATSIPDQSCRSMFQGCTSLTTAPVLPATTLGVLSYGDMFSGCASLTTAPELPESSVVDAFTQGSYQGMFAGCSNIIRIKCLATSVGQYSFNFWVNGVSPTGTFVKKAGANWPTGPSGIPSGWTVIEE